MSSVSRYTSVRTGFSLGVIAAVPFETPFRFLGAYLSIAAGALGNQRYAHLKASNGYHCGTQL